MTVNVENINKTIARIRANQNFKFNMGSWGASDIVQTDKNGHFCGTSACIAGFAMIANKTFPVKQIETRISDKDNSVVNILIDVLDIGVDAYQSNDFFIEHGIEVLGLTYSQGASLFTPFCDYVYDAMKDKYYEGPDYMRATEDQAIRVLEHLRDTGEVNWTISGVKPHSEGFFVAWQKQKGEDYSVSKCIKGDEKVQETA